MRAAPKACWGQALAFLALLAPGCDPAPDKAPAGPSLTASAAPAPSSLEGRSAKSVFYGTCAKCHTMGELAGKTVSDMKKALQTVPLMRRYQGQISDAELAALERLLAGPQAP